MATYQEAGESRIVANLLALIDSNMKARLDEFYLADNLPAFARMTLGEANLFDSFPLLVIGPERMSSTEAESGEWLEQDLRIGIGFVVKDTSVNNVIRRAMKYVRALKAVIRSATTAQLIGPASSYMDHVVDIDHQYLRHGTKGTEFTQPVEFEVKIRYGEK